MLFQEILSSIKSLPREEQLLLCDVLRHDLFPVEIDPELLAEVERRSELFDQGKMSALPWDEVRARALRAAGLELLDDQ